MSIQGNLNQLLGTVGAVASIGKVVEGQQKQAKVSQEQLELTKKAEATALKEEVSGMLQGGLADIRDEEAKAQKEFDEASQLDTAYRGERPYDKSEADFADKALQRAKEMLIGKQMQRELIEQRFEQIMKNPLVEQDYKDKVSSALDRFNTPTEKDANMQIMLNRALNRGGKQ